MAQDDRRTAADLMGPMNGDIPPARLPSGAGTALTAQAMADAWAGYEPWDGAEPSVLPGLAGLVGSAA